jgi:hypothetical protein
MLPIPLKIPMKNVIDIPPQFIPKVHKLASKGIVTVSAAILEYSLPATLVCQVGEILC